MLRRLWQWLTAGTVFTAIAALATVAAALYARGQISAADQQKVASQQSQLLALVVAIEQEPVERQLATAHLTGSALEDTDIDYQDQLTSDAQAAKLVLESLSSGQVAPFEYDQVGSALSKTSDIGDALKLFQIASRIRGAPLDTTTTSLRDSGYVRYELGESALSHRDFMHAAAIAAHARGALSSDAHNDEAHSYFQDAGYQLVFHHCEIAAADVSAGKQVLSHVSSQNQSSQNMDLLSDDRTLRRTDCPGGG